MFGEGVWEVLLVYAHMCLLGIDYVCMKILNCMLAILYYLIYFLYDYIHLLRRFIIQLGFN